MAKAAIAMKESFYQARQTSDILQEIFDGIVADRLDTVLATVQEALDENVVPRAVLKESTIGAMNKVGQILEDSEYYLSEMLLTLIMCA